MYVVTLRPQKLALTSPTRGDRSVDIVRSRTQATELVAVVSRESLILVILSLTLIHIVAYILCNYMKMHNKKQQSFFLTC
jgi:hypothetical protein